MRLSIAHIEASIADTELQITLQLDRMERSVSGPGRHSVMVLDMLRDAVRRKRQVRQELRDDFENSRLLPALGE